MSTWCPLQRNPEKEFPEFRREIDELARSGLRIAGLAGIALPTLLIVFAVFILNLPVALVGKADVSTAIWDELAISFLAAGLLMLSFSSRAARHRRWLFAVFLWLAAGVVLLDDLVHTGHLLSTDYLSLLVLVAIGTMPFRRLQMLAVGIGILALYLGLALVYRVDLDADGLLFLCVLILLAVWLCGLLSDSRFHRFELLRQSVISEERYRSLFHDASDAIFTIDNMSGRFLEVNPALERLLGVAASELRRMSFLDIVHPDDRALVIDYHSKRIRGEVAPAQYQFRVIAPATGTVHVCDVAIHRGTAKGLTAGIARDLTERIRAEQTIRDYAQQLEQSNREIVATQARLLQAEKNAAMADLIAGVVHEINSPLAVVQCNVDVAARAMSKVVDDCRTSPAVAERSCSIIQDSCAAARSAVDRISSIVKSLKSFAQLDQADVQNIDVNRAVTDTLDLLKYRIQDRITVKTHLSPLPAFRCQARNINQMIAIMVRRSIEAMRDSGTLSIATRSAFGIITITIRDTGTALTTEQQAHLFDPRLTVRDQRVGLGLELPIAHQVAIAHGGNIEVESIPEIGTTITISLPLANEV